MLDWLPTAVAIVLFLGATAVYLRGSKDKGTIDSLERSNKALNEELVIVTKKITLLEETIRDDAARRAVDHQRIRSLEQEKSVLEGIANSSELITAQTELIKSLGDIVTKINTDVSNHHAAAMAGVIQLHEDLETLPARLADQFRSPT